MDNPHSAHPWQIQDRFLEIHSRWMTLIGEHLQDDRGEILEYWRIEKADSAIVLPIHDERILFPTASYRAGISKITLDFPGGRVPEGHLPEQAAIAVLKRELGIKPDAIAQLTPLNIEGWAVNSSFSNQKLYGFVAYIKEIPALPPQSIAATYPVTSAGVNQLLQELNCLQCRAVLLEWIILNDRRASRG